MTESGAPKPSRKVSRAPGIAFLAIAAVVATFVAALPRTGNQAPPPTVAEFAPDAAREIRKALQGQTSRFGSGPGGCEEGESCPGPTTSAKPLATPEITPPATRQCVGNPPMQTEDPQSPPCRFWAGGSNGGATSKGVTANSIIVALPVVDFEDPAEVELLVEHFNRRYEFYGRKIVIERYKVRGGLNQRPQPEQELADAKDVDEKVRAFASLTTGGRFGSEHLYYDELARRGIISVAHRAGTKTDEAYLRRFRPYRWSVLPGIDTMQRHIAEMVCKVLAGNAPEYAGPGVTGAKRVFGLIRGRANDGTEPALDRFRRELKACGVTLAADVVHVQSGSQSEATSTILKMVDAGVTSVVCFCDGSEVSGYLMPSASSAQYRPEWIGSTYIDMDIDNSFEQAPPDQATHVLGATFRNKWLPREYMFWYRALKEIAPDYDPPVGSGRPLAARYSSLLLLAAGIQLAGPNLTPQTFEQGLLRTPFANPGAGRAPYYQARVGFDGGRHTMIADAAMYWYSRSDRGTVDPASLGAVCYVDQGRRYGFGAWPNDDPGFFGDCR
jgi:hypothetical protein